MVEARKNDRGETNKRRILFYTSSFSGQSGATHCMMRTAQTLAQLNGKLICLALPARDQSEIEKFSAAAAAFAAVHFNPGAYKLSKRRNPFYYLKYVCDSARGIAAMYMWLRRHPVDIVHANDLLDFHGAIAGWLAGSKVVWHLRTVRSRLVVGPFLWIMRALSTRILAVSRDTARKMLGDSQQKVAVVYDSPPDADVFDPAKYPRAAQQRLRAALGIQDNEFVIGMVGKLVRLKGHEAFLRACQRLLKLQPHCKFIIVGGPVPGHEQYERSLRGLAGELGLSSRLIMTGFRADVPALIAIFDVMLQLSIFDDPFPGVVLQGMAMEKTVAASNRGGVLEQIEDGVTGILVDPHDAAGVAQRLSELLENAPGRQRLGTAARRAVYHKFKDDAVIINAIYDSLLNEVRETASV